MVLSASQAEENKSKSNKSFFIGFFIFSVLIGIIVGLSLSDWVLGVLMGISVLILGISLLLVSVFFGLICIPPMILIDKLTGKQKTNQKKSNEVTPGD